MNLVAIALLDELYCVLKHLPQITVAATVDMGWRERVGRRHAK
jgi:hypothetical protein